MSESFRFFILKRNLEVDVYSPVVTFNLFVMWQLSSFSDPWKTISVQIVFVTNNNILICPNMMKMYAILMLQIIIIRYSIITSGLMFQALNISTVLSLNNYKIRTTDYSSPKCIMRIWRFFFFILCFIPVRATVNSRTNN